MHLRCVLFVRSVVVFRRSLFVSPRYPSGTIEKVGTTYIPAHVSACWCPLQHRNVHITHIYMFLPDFNAIAVNYRRAECMSLRRTCEPLRPETPPPPSEDAAGDHPYRKRSTKYHACRMPINSVSSYRSGKSNPRIPAEYRVTLR